LNLYDGVLNEGNFLTPPCHEQVPRPLEFEKVPSLQLDIASAEETEKVARLAAKTSVNPNPSTFFT
jgi:hypothetical protein